MVAPSSTAGGSQTAISYSSEPQAVPQKRRARSKLKEGKPESPGSSQWIDDNEVRESPGEVGGATVVEIVCVSLGGIEQ